MKSLAELEAIRNNAKSNMNVRTNTEGKKVLVGMATCGIAAGARPVLQAFVEEVAKIGKYFVADSSFSALDVGDMRSGKAKPFSKKILRPTSLYAKSLDILTNGFPYTLNVSHSAKVKHRPKI